VSSSKVLGSLLIAIIAALVAGCGAGAPASSSNGDSFPLTLNTAKGKLTIPHRPVRIVSLSPTATEDLFAIGAGRQVVAVDSFSTYPPEAPKTTLSGFTPNIEAIAAYKPDLVVASDDIHNLVDQLDKLQIPTLLEPVAADLNGVYSEINQIAQATGHLPEAGVVVSGMQRQVQAVVKSAPPASRRLTVYHELDQTYYSATTHTFIGQVYKLLGVESIADRAPGGTDYPQLSAEFIISSNPDLIVLADTVCCGQSPTTVQARAGWSSIKAVKTGAVAPVADDVASQWGPRIVLFMQAVATALKKVPAQT